MSAENPITDADLHAYVDGQLSQEHRSEIERYLDAHPQARQRVQRYQALNDALRLRYSSVADEPLPGRLQRSIPKARLRIGSIAAALGWLVVGGVLGTLLQNRWVAPPTAGIEVDLVRPAAFAHAVYTPERSHAVDVTADQEAYLVDWLSQRLHTEIRAPNLTGTGYHLVGGRLLPSTNRMAAQFMYENATGERITLYVRTGAWGNSETAFRYGYEDGVGVFYWVDGAKGYAVSGQVGRQALLRIATAAYQGLSAPN